MKIKFWGVRGSIPTPGSNTKTYGGNTACIEIITDHPYYLIIDLGSGLKAFGEDIVCRPKKSENLKIYAFITHTHWDHIMGFPFFVPNFIPNSEINIFGPESYEDETLEKVVGGQLSYRYFPVRRDELAARLSFTSLKEGSMELPGGIRVSYKYLNHPVLCLGYRLEYEGKVFCTCYDHEPFRNLFADDPDNFAEGEAIANEENNKIMEFFRKADFLIMDSQYTVKEYQTKIGWGHGTYKNSIETAHRIGIKKLALFHHDPHRLDAHLKKLEKYYKEKIKGKSTLEMFVAREGETIDV